MAISFNQIGSFKGIVGGADVLANSTSLQFGPDGRLYVTEQNGSVNAFTIALQNGQYVATAHEELLLTNGGGVVKSIMNHNDDGSLNAGLGDRQVTGVLVTGTAANPVLYVSSSDPRIATNGEQNLDTNSGIVTRVTWNGTAWVAVDILRGLPRSEENHSNNGMVLSADGTKLYLAVGGNTNNGAPSSYFSYTAEYALSGTVLEIDLTAINNLPILTDSDGGQINGGAVSRQYIYDLPTLDDPNVPNVTGGVGENAAGLDENGPFGGNDGLNMAILPANAPLRIYADGFRNNYDLVLRADGKLYTVDNGSNTGLGGDPLIVNGKAVNTPVNGGVGDAEPLFLVQDGSYYGHANPTRSNQNLAWTVYNNSGTPDTSLAVNTVANLSALVPASVNIASGFLIDPSKFTGNAARLLQSGIRIPYANQPNSLVELGSSSNGLVEYTGTAYGGALQGALVVAQFNNTITLLNVNNAGTALEPFIDPGLDGLLGTPDDVVLAANGIYTLITGLSTPLDVTTGPDGTIWVAEIGGSSIKVYKPGGAVVNPNDSDNDGILNVNDPFIRDASNGTSVNLFPGQTLVWDFDPNQDGNRPGPVGFATGLTGVMINGTTDFEAFFNSASNLPQQQIKLDNIKFATAAGGGTTVVEYVSNGDALGTANSGEYLFQTGLQISPTVDTFNIKWSVFNPLLTGANQQIGGYIGTGDQSNYLKIVATANPAGEIQILLENNNVVSTQVFLQADDLFTVPIDQQIFFELNINPITATATPKITYEIGGGNTKVVTGAPISLSGTGVLNAILGNNIVQGQSSGLAVGLYSSNTGQPAAPAGPSFQAVFGDITITGTGTPPPALYRVNAGGPTITATDGGPNWVADTPFLLDAGSNSFAGFPAVNPGPTVPTTTPGTIFDTERYDSPGGTELQYGFAVAAGTYEVRLYMGNGYTGTAAPGQRVFDVALEGQVKPNLNNIDLVTKFGNVTGGLISNTVQVTDGTLNIQFLHDPIDGIENPLINGIEIIKLSDLNLPTVSIVGGPYSVGEAGGQVQISLLSNKIVPVGQTVTVNYEIVPGTATPQADYSAGGFFLPETGKYTGTATIASGSADATFLVNILQDTLVEGNETFAVNITSVSSNALIGTGSATVTIVDDDATGSGTVLYRVNAGGPTVTAIDGGPNWVADTTFLLDPGSNSVSGFVAVDPGLTVPTTTPGTIFDTERYDAAGGTEMQYGFAVAAGTYEVRLYMGNGFSGTAAPGQRVFDVALEGTVLSTLNDVDLSAKFGNQVGGMISNTVSVTDGTLNIQFLHMVENPLINGIEIIQQSSSPTSSITLAVAPSSVAEDGTPNLVYTFTRTGSLTSALTVNYGVGGTATFNSDYIQTGAASFAATAGTITFAAGSSTAALTIDPTADTTPESDETVALTLAAGTGYTVGTATAVTGTITNDDVAASSSITLAVAPSSVAEDGTPNLVYTFTRTGSLTSALTVNYGVGGTATFNSDYIQTGAASFAATAGTITFAAGSSTAALTIDPTADTTPESDETVALTLAAGTGYTVGTATAVTGTITNDDVAAGSSITLAVAPSSVAEDGTPNLVYTFTRTGSLTSALTVNYGVGGTATFNSDYIQTGAASFAATAGTITFAAGSSTASLTIDPTADTTPESDETVALTLAAGTGYTVGTATAVTGTITNDDASGSGTVLYRVNAGGPAITAIDGGPNWGIDAPFLLDAGSNSFSGFVAVDPGLTVPTTTPGTIFDTERYDAAGGTEMQYGFAVAAGTYEVRLYMGNGFSGTAAPGQRVFDVALEGTVLSTLNDIDLSAKFGNQVGGMISNTVSVTDGTLNIQFLHMVENPLINGIEIIQQSSSPTSSITLAVAPSSVAEDGTPNLVYTFTRTGSLTSALTVNYGVGGTATFNSDYIQTGAASFASTAGTITFAAGSSTAALTIDPTADTTPESDETVALTLSAGTGYTVGTATAVTGTITNDDVAASSSITLAVAPSSVAEDGTPNMVYTFTRTGSITSALTVNYGVGGTATLNSDYIQTGATSFAATAGTITFAAGSSTAALTIDPTADTTPESDETVALTLAAGTGYTVGTAAAVTGTITNDDSVVASKQVSIATITQASEPSSKGVFTVSLSQAATNNTIVAYSIAGTATPGSDYTALSGTVTIPVNQQSATIDVSVLDDKIIENAETVIVNLTGATGDAGLVLGANKTATVTIADNDSPIRLEAEAASAIVNYRKEAIGVASGGQVLSFLGGGAGESGSATFGFNGTAGAYDILLGTFDENDGVASFTVQFKDVETNTTTQIASLTLNANLGSGLANAQTFISPKVASGINLTPGDSLIVNGLENGSEHARLDFLQLNPVLI
jgi:Malectin domain/Calx-beta domain